MSKPPRGRILIPTVLIIVWFAIFGIGGSSFGAISDVATNDRASFLPESAESTVVGERLADFLGDDALPAIVVVEKQEALSDDEVASLQGLGDLSGASQASPAILSEDGRAAQVVLLFPPDAEPTDAVAGVEEALDTNPVVMGGAEAWVTGPAGFSADLSAAFAGIDGTLLMVTISAVFIILVLVYRSPLLPILVMLSSLTALCLAVLVNVQLARAGLVTVNGQVQGILFILVIGAATDYSLLLIARYRELLATQDSSYRIAVMAVRRTFEPVIASAGTVIAGLMCLLLSDLVSNSALGPVASVGIVASVLTSLTFLPALLAVCGKAAFWPRIPGRTTNEHKAGLWTRIGHTIEKRPRSWAAGVFAFLVIGCAGLPLLNASGVPSSEFVLGQSQARDGQEALDRHFPGGSGSPTYVIVEEEHRQSAEDAVTGVPGVDSVSVISQGDMPTQVDGDVLLQVTLTDPPDSRAASETVTAIRAELENLPGETLVGGETAIDVDTNTTSIHDRTLIIPIVLVVITIMLAFLLRSLVAPIVLLLTTVLSFGTALGISAVIFTLVGFTASDPSVPLYAFVFLVALGIDYNIFLMTRVREESLEHGTHQGTLRGLALTGGVITSAGIVLAATFAALGVIPIQFLAQLAIIVSLGVLIDALIVRSYFVPALTLLLGRRMWWPAVHRS